MFDLSFVVSMYPKTDPFQPLHCNNTAHIVPVRSPVSSNVRWWWCRWFSNNGTGSGRAPARTNSRSTTLTERYSRGCLTRKTSSSHAILGFCIYLDDFSNANICRVLCWINFLKYIILTFWNTVVAQANFGTIHSWRCDWQRGSEAHAWSSARPGIFNMARHSTCYLRCFTMFSFFICF